MKDLESNKNPLFHLKRFTSARIALGRVGASVPLKQSLELKLAHAHARDAVYSTLSFEGLTKGLENFQLPVLHLHSKAQTRHKYLKRPDYGRQLDDESNLQLTELKGAFDVVIIIADGLSATAINDNAVGLLNILMPMLKDAGLKIAPICLVEQGRVAIGDDIAQGLGAMFSVVLIGERPGLSAADSMGCYLTYNPKPGLTDEARNCISNIRPQGLKHQPAAAKIFYLINEAFKRKLSGVKLKDNAGYITDRPWTMDDRP